MYEVIGQGIAAEIIQTPWKGLLDVRFAPGKCSQIYSAASDSLSFLYAGCWVFVLLLAFYIGFVDLCAAVRNVLGNRHQHCRCGGGLQVKWLSSQDHSEIKLSYMSNSQALPSVSGLWTQNPERHVSDSTLVTFESLRDFVGTIFALNVAGKREGNIHQGDTLEHTFSLSGGLRSVMLAV